MSKTQLLCTFCTPETLDITLDSIKSTYNIAFGTIYVLENVDDTSSLCCTYNVDVEATSNGKLSEGTISLHRKKATNTLYTINALNMLIVELNDGVLDHNYKIEWNDFKNTILVVAYNKLKKIHTKLHKIVKV